MTANLITSAGILSLLVLATNGLGFVRELLFARAFGAGREADAYITAFSIVAVCFLVFSAGSLQGAFMPRYQQSIIRGDKAKARSLWRSTATALWVVLLAIALATFLKADLWVALTVPGFDSSMRQMTADVLRVLSPMIVLFGVGALLQSVLHAHYRFIAAALIPVCNNAVLIATLILFVPYMGLVAYGAGTLIGASLWLVLFPFVYRELPRNVPSRFDASELRALASVMAPLLVLLVVDQLAGLIQKSLVSDLQTGSIAVLNYAARLEGLPVGIFASAITTAIFPALVAAMSVQDERATSDRFHLGLAAIAFFSVPATLLMVFEPLLIAKALLERGAFMAEDSLRVAEALRWYALGLLPQSLIVFLNRVYFAAGDTRTPMLVGVLSAVIHVLLCWLLVKSLGYIGIAIGTTIYALLYSALLLWRLERVMLAPLAALARALWRPMIAGTALAALLLAVQFPGTPTSLALALVMGGGVYVTVGLLLKDPILAMLVPYLWRGRRHRAL